MKEQWKSVILFVIYAFAVLVLTTILWEVSQESTNAHDTHRIILGTKAYSNSGVTGFWETLKYRVNFQPFNLASLIIFVCAVIHTFFAPTFNQMSQRLRSKKVKEGADVSETFGVEILRLLGEVEVIFGIWIIPLLITMSFYFDWATCIFYLSDLDYTEPLFVVVIMTLASTKPVIHLAEDCLRLVAKLWGESTQAWWWSILTLGPLAGSLITEPGAMTISALLLSKQFYRLKPSRSLAYATLGLLFTNISVGGVFTSFAAPPILMVSKAWDWDTMYLINHFGNKAVIGILLSNALYYLIFRQELGKLNEKRLHFEEKHGKKVEKGFQIPFWISLVHLTFLAWIVVHSHFPVIFIGAFLLFVGFHRATIPYQERLNLKPPVLVGFFLAGLVVHGNLQAWWITLLLENTSKEVLMLLSTVLTAFNDNAEVTFLATLVPSLDEAMKLAVVAGAVTGGGLTVIANAPNPLGQALLSEYFPTGVKPSKLFFAAFTPTVIMGCCFYFLSYGFSFFTGNGG